MCNVYTYHVHFAIIRYSQLIKTDVTEVDGVAWSSIFLFHFICIYVHTSIHLFIFISFAIKHMLYRLDASFHSKKCILHGNQATRVTDTCLVINCRRREKKTIV